MANDRDEMKAALEADRERKQRESKKLSDVKDEGELEDMREYIHVAMDEMENLRDELLAAKEATATAQSEAEASIAVEKEKFNEKLRAKWTASSFWKWLSLIELLVFAVALLVIVIMKPRGNDTVIIEHYGNEAKIEKETEVIKTRKLNDNLAGLVSDFNKTDGGDYIMSVISIDGYEYLSLEGPYADIYYRNEFSLDSKDLCEVGVSSGIRTVYFPESYDLSNPLSLIPVELKKRDGEGASLVFIRGGESGITESMTFVDSDTLAVYTLNPFKDYIESLFEMTILSGVGNDSLNAGGVRLQTGGRDFDYILDSASFNSLLYNDTLVIDFKSGYKLEVIGNSLEWSSDLKIGDECVLGKLCGVITAGSAIPELENVRFKAYTSDVTASMPINVLDRIPEDCVEILDVTGRSFLVERPTVVTLEVEDDNEQRE